jgi:hypothetical protein
MTPAPNVLSVDDLAANRAGRLADNQRTRWVGLERAWTGGLRLGALAFAGVGVASLLGVGGGIGNPTDLVATVACFALAAMLGWVSIVPGRRLARDVAEGRVETVEGPIERRRADRPYGGSMRRFFLYVKGHGYEVTRTLFDEAPREGPVRLYVLPRSHKVVGMELAGGADGDVGRDDAAPRFVGRGDDRPIDSAIVGTWRGQGMTATFSPDGTAEARLPNGIDIAGRWSVGADGRLHVSGFGEDTTAEAVIDGDALEVRMDGVRLPFRREVG